MVKSVRTVLGLMLVLGAVAACDDNPMSDGRDEGEFMFTNPTVATVMSGDSVQVTARVFNRYLAPTGAAVTATPCDAGITVAADTTRTQFEAPERFWVYTTGASVGPTCLVVAGGGITDTINFMIGAGSVTLVAANALGSGESLPLDVTFQNAAGETVPGFTIADVVFTSSNANVVFIDAATNTMVGRAPGTANVIATTIAGRGAPRADTVAVTVTAGAFTGTFSPANLQWGSLLTLTAGAIPFDADTRVSIGGIDAFIVPGRTATTIQAVVPGVPGPTALVAISNLGPNQVASVFTAPVTASEVHEPNNTRLTATAGVLTLGTPVYGVVSETDTNDYFSFTVPADGTVVFDLNWSGTAAQGDIDAYIYNSAGTGFNFGCATGAKPEHCTMAVTAGTWYARVNFYEATQVLGYSLLVTLQ